MTGHWQQARSYDDIFYRGHASLVSSSSLLGDKARDDEAVRTFFSLDVYST
jgi:hypothetical protein